MWRRISWGLGEGGVDHSTSTIWLCPFWWASQLNKELSPNKKKQTESAEPSQPLPDRSRPQTYPYNTPRDPLRDPQADLFGSLGDPCQNPGDAPEGASSGLPEETSGGPEGDPWGNPVWVGGAVGRGWGGGGWVGGRGLSPVAPLGDFPHPRGYLGESP
jgi:hypothetical protein